MNCRLTLEFPGLGHGPVKDGQGTGCNSGEHEKPRIIAPGVDDVPSHDIAEGRADALRRRDGAKGEIISSGSFCQIRNHRDPEDSENSGSDTIQPLDGDDKKRVVAERIQEAANRKNHEANQKNRLASPAVCLCFREDAVTF